MAATAKPWHSPAPAATPCRLMTELRGDDSHNHTHRPPQAGIPQAGTLPPDATPTSEKNRLTPAAAEPPNVDALEGGALPSMQDTTPPQEPRLGPAKPAPGLQAQIRPEPARRRQKKASVDASPADAPPRRPPSSPRKLRRVSLRRWLEERRSSSPPDATAPRGRPSAREEEIPPPPAPSELCPAAPAGGGRGGEEGGGCWTG
nr:proline-rich receptor-like protein kinase PERK12 [Lolium perenne]